MQEGAKMKKQGSEKNIGSAAATATTSSSSSAGATTAAPAAKKGPGAEPASSAAAPQGEKQAPIKKEHQKTPKEQPREASPEREMRKPKSAAGKTQPQGPAGNNKEEVQQGAGPKKVQTAAEAEKGKENVANASAEKQQQEKKSEQTKKEESEKKEPQPKSTSAESKSKSGLSSSTKRSAQQKAYGVMPPPSFMLSEMVQEDAMFSNFQYVALTECDDRVYGYGTLSADSTASLGDEGMVDFDPATNRFHLIYWTKFAMERQSTAGSSRDIQNGSAHTSPGCRHRATLVARRIKSEPSSSVDASVGEQNLSGAGGKEATEKEKGIDSSGELPWRLLLFGGFDQSSGDVSNDVWEFRLPPRPSPAPLLPLPSVGSWRELPVTGTKPAPRGDHAVCLSATKTRMYLFGGIGRDDTLLNDCYVLTESDKWVQLSAGTTGTSSSSVPAPRRCHTLVAGSASSSGATLYLFGGDLTTRGRQASNELWKYNVQRNNWIRITLAAGMPPTPRYHHASAFASNKVWIGGGLSPGWLGPTDLKDLYGFDVTALFWFQCVISLGKVQQPLPRFRPLAFIPATRSFFIFGCSEHKRYQQTQAAVCALIPVCTMESLVPLKGLNADVKKGIDELAEHASGMGQVLHSAEEKLSILRQHITELEEKRKLLQQKLRVVAEKRDQLRVSATQLSENRIGKKFDEIEKLCPQLEKLNKTAEDIGNVIQQTKTILNTKAAAADIAFLADALEQLRNES